jgi:hypothetical protein
MTSKIDYEKFPDYVKTWNSCLPVKALAFIYRIQA